MILPISICNCDINTGGGRRGRSGDIRSFAFGMERAEGGGDGTHVHQYTMEMREQGKQFDKAMQSP